MDKFLGMSLFVAGFGLLSWLVSGGPAGSRPSRSSHEKGDTYVAEYLRNTHSLSLALALVGMLVAVVRGIWLVVA